MPSIAAAITGGCWQKIKPLNDALIYHEKCRHSQIKLLQTFKTGIGYKQLIGPVLFCNQPLVTFWECISELPAAQFLFLFTKLVLMKRSWHRESCSSFVEKKLPLYRHNAGIVIISIFVPFDWLIWRTENNFCNLLVPCLYQSQ